MNGIVLSSKHVEGHSNFFISSKGKSSISTHVQIGTCNCRLTFSQVVFHLCLSNYVDLNICWRSLCLEVSMTLLLKKSCFSDSLYSNLRAKVFLLKKVQNLSVQNFFFTWYDFYLFYSKFTIFKFQKCLNQFKGNLKLW